MFMNKKLASSIFIMSLFGTVFFYLLKSFNFQYRFWSIATQSIFFVGMLSCGIALVLSALYLIVSNCSKIGNFSKRRRANSSNFESTAIAVKKNETHKKIGRIKNMKKRTIAKKKPVKKAAPKKKIAKKVTKKAAPSKKTVKKAAPKKTVKRATSKRKVVKKAKKV
jgi:hypothetical protein